MERTTNDPLDWIICGENRGLVECMLALHQKTPLAPQEETALTSEIEATDRQIDALVYELYDLTHEEIKIVEGEQLRIVERVKTLFPLCSQVKRKLADAEVVFGPGEGFF